MVDLLRAFAGEGWREHELIFPNRVGKPLREDHVLAAFHKVCEDAGLPRKRLHDLRHTYATFAHASGADLHDLKNVLGHSRIDMTSHIYTGYAVERIRRAVEGIAGLYGEVADEEAEAAS
jgi:integrase